MSDRIVPRFELGGQLLERILKREIADGTARWAPSPKAKWANYLESKKEFNKVYAPLLAGDLFKGIPYFDGKKYDELARIFPPIQW